MRIGFLFNHDQIHQVAHALPIAFALRQAAPEADIVIATGNPALTAEVKRLSAAIGLSLPVVELGIRRPLTRLYARHLEALIPITKIGVLRDNLDFFRTFDVLVVTEKTSLLLRDRYGLEDLRIVHTRHGAGDRAIGFDAKSARFDHVLVSGAKIRDRLIAEAGVSPDAISTVGYPKFDLRPALRPPLPFRDPSKPTVLYNPHVSPHLSSWYRDGQAVLDQFVRDDRYNLIFAPHCMLFHRRFVLTIDRLRLDRPGAIPRAVREAPNIHVDLGTAASCDMTYTAAADIYLGDVSSQVYEFLLEPRPCVFLDSHRTPWVDDANYAHWQAGEVIGDVAALGAALDRAQAAHAGFAAAQARLFAASFDLTTQSSASRAAHAILRVAAVPSRSSSRDRAAA